MDSIRVSKVENVTFLKTGSSYTGTVHLTAHHLIFQFDQDAQKENWVPYPLISLVTRLPQTLHGQCPLTFHSRTFETFSLLFSKETDAVDVFESVKELTVSPSVYQLYAFFYSPSPPLPSNNGWNIYSLREEFGRMGVGTRTKAWRFTDINKDFTFCPTYPARLVVPTKISDTTLQYASKYRSKCRIPVLSYLHWSNFGSITRSSQPMVGITQNRSIQDEKLIEAIFQTHHNPESRASGGTVYGATTTNLIIDARPTTNAMANTAKGAGTENMDHYKEGKKVYLGIDHIHAMRESLAKVVEALREADALLASINNDLSGQVSNISVLDRQALRRSGWLRHITAILEGTALIVRNVHINSSHVLIHCSDGWDRTSQLSSLSQLCLDPFYRTIKGFEILIEKDWLSYGHKFLDRCGHLSSDKFFVSTNETPNASSGPDAAQAFLASVQNRFASQQHIKETSPVFHQFLESVRQIQRQFPQRFEFNERFLHQLYYHLYSCQFGTFLLNSERERRVGEGGNAPPVERTVSVWDYLNIPAEMEQNLNPEYDPSLDNPTSRQPNADMGVLYPNGKDVRFWHELYGRTDEEMNGRVVSPQGKDVDSTLEADNDTSRSATPLSSVIPPSPPEAPLESTPPSRSASTADSAQMQTSDLLSPSPRPTALNREESFRPLSSTTSAFSMKTTPGAFQPSTSPGRVGGLAQDLFGNSSMKSVWGRLSSNASAALSVVQEAYGGVAKDLRNSGSHAADGGKTRELIGRESLNAWGDEQPPAPSPSNLQQVRPLSTVNPWASVRGSPSKSAPLLADTENPWGSVHAGPKEVPALSNVTFEPPSPSLLPVDPTVALPEVPARKTTPQPQPARVDNTTDPLGVGIL